MTPHVLLLATQRWPTGARLGMAMRAAGFRVSIWSPHGHPLLLTDAFERHHLCGAFEPLASLEAAVLAARPDLLVPCDDLATFRVQQLAGRSLDNPRLSPILSVIERSLGTASRLSKLTARAHVLDVAAAAGIAVPANSPIASAGELRAWFAAHGFPAYLKADGTSGGIGVRPVRTYDEAEAAFRILDAPPGALRALKRMAIDRDPTLLGPLVRRQRPSISVQQAVCGAEANSAVFCWEGRVLAGITVQVLTTLYERGPSTVLRRIHNAAMERAAELLASRLQLSGFYGFDFMLDEQSGAPWLLEMNSRATQIAHLALGVDQDLAAAAFGAISGMPIQRRPLLTKAETIALFPQEWHRDASSPLIQSAYHDVPWEAPALVCAYVNQTAGRRQMLTSQYWRELRAPRRSFQTATPSEAASRHL